MVLAVTPVVRRWLLTAETPGHSVGDVWSRKWYWGTFFFQYFSFPMSV